MRCKRHSHDYIMRCEVCLLEKMAVSSRSTGRAGGAEGMSTIQLDGEIRGVPEDEDEFFLELVEWLAARGCIFKGWAETWRAVSGNGHWTPENVREALKVEAG